MIENMIGIGASLSLPQFNIKDVNNALITLLNNPDCDFEDIYCAPDFATGGILLNESEVKESLKYGTGKSCKLRSVVEYDADEHCLIVKEVPYGVYTNTICGELEGLLNSEQNVGFNRFNDLTGAHPNIKIYLTKNANPAQVIKFLYKNTSLQSHFSINMTMLEDGRFPKVFGWKEALQAHIDHEKIVYRRGFEYDLRKLAARLHIVQGIIKCLDDIEEVIRLIKSSKSTTEASEKLQEKFELDEIQAKAVLDIKLARLAHLEIEKYLAEKDALITEMSHIENILNDNVLFNQQLIDGWKEVITQFGDERRTKIMDIEKEDEEEPIEKKQLVVYLTNHNNLYAYEDTVLISQKRGGHGTRIKLANDEFISQIISTTNYHSFLAFSNLGKLYNLKVDDIPLNIKTPIQTLLNLNSEENISLLVNSESVAEDTTVVFVTKNGLVKRTYLKEYNTRKATGVVAIKLKEEDEIAKVLLMNGTDSIMIGTEQGYLVHFDIDQVPITGRNTSGVKGITLRKDDIVIGAITFKEGMKQILSLTSNGSIKRTDISEFTKGNRANKGIYFHGIDEGETVVAFEGVSLEHKEVITTTSHHSIKFKIDEVPVLSRTARGNQAIKIKDDEKITGVNVV